jgi:hypothetical protein
MTGLPEKKDCMGLTEVRRGFVGAIVCAIVAGGALYASSEAKSASTSRPPRLSETAKADVVTILSARREDLRTIEAARASAEDDLRTALDREPVDEARIVSLVAEIVAFGGESTAVEAKTQAQLNELLDKSAARISEPPSSAFLRSQTRWYQPTKSWR